MRCYFLTCCFFVFSCSISYAQSSSHIVEWSTYFVTADIANFGGFDIPSVTTDKDGNVVFAAEVWGNPIIPHPDAFQTQNAGYHDILIAKFSRDGELLWTTYFGGSREEELGLNGHGRGGKPIAIDTSGNIFIAGCTRSTDFPVTPDASQQGNHSGKSFITKFSPTGQLLWSRLYAATSITAIALDKQGNPAITGMTYDGLPTTNDAFQPRPTQKIGTEYRSAFIARFSANGKHLWSTYYSSEEMDRADGIAVDTTGAIIITGVTNGDLLPVSADAFQPQSASPGVSRDGDAFIAKFDSSGIFQWGTYYSTEMYDRGHSLAVLSDNSIVLLGVTASNELPGANGDSFMQYANNPFYRGGVFLLKWTPTGALVWATYSGIEATDHGAMLATYGNDRIALAMESKSKFLHLVDPLPFPSPDTTTRIYFAEFQSDGQSMIWGSTFITGGNVDIVYTPNGHIVLAGSTCWLGKHELPTTEGAYQETLDSNQVSFFLTQFGCRGTEPTLPSSHIFLCEGTGQVISAPEGFTRYRWRPTGDTTRSILLQTPGSYRVLATDTYNCINSDTIDVTVLPLPQARIIAPRTTTCNTDSIRLEVKMNEGTSCRWSTGDTTAVIYAHISDLYYVTVFYPELIGSTTACIATDSVSLQFYSPNDIILSTTSVVFTSSPCSSTTEHTLHLTNTGSYDVNVGTWSLEGDPEFKLIKPTGFVSVAPGNSMEIVVQYKPVSVSASASLKFTTYPCNFGFAVELSGTTSSLLLPEEVDFDCLLSCSSIRDTLIEITNTGSMPIVLEKIEADAPFIAALPNEITVLPHQKTSVNIGILSHNAGLYTGTITLLYSSNNCYTSATITVRATIEELTVKTAYSIDIGMLVTCKDTLRTTTTTLDVSGACLRPLTIKSISITEPFSSSLQPGMVLPIGRTDFTITFAPLSIGATTGSCIIEFEQCAITTSLSLSGSIDSLSVETVSTATFPLLDIGAARQSEQDIEFRNTSAFPITVAAVGCLTQPFEIVAPSATQLPVVVQPNELLHIRLRFSTQQVGIFHDTLCISGDIPCAFTSSIALNATATYIYAQSFVEMPYIQTDIGKQDIAIPLILTKEEHLSEVQASAFRTTISLNPTLFKPLLISRGTFRERQMAGRLFIDIDAQLPVAPQEGDTLLSLLGATLYGNSPTTQLVFENFEWTNTNVDEHTQDGMLTLNVCFPQGLKVLPRTTMRIVGEHPVSDQLTLYLDNVYEGTVLELWSMTGQKVLTQLVKNNGEYIIDLRTANVGIYRVVLRDLFDTLSLPVVIVR